MLKKAKKLSMRILSEREDRRENQMVLDSCLLLQPEGFQFSKDPLLIIDVLEHMWNLMPT